VSEDVRLQRSVEPASQVVVAEPAAPAVEPIAEVPSAASVEYGPPVETPPAPEIGFAARVSPPEPERPLPARRRGVFFDVENTSRAEHIARVLDHLRIDRAAARTDFVAVGNWRVIGHETARLLAQRGAQLIHSAPSVGIRDWSDLRIAVAAGVWMASGRPGDVVEIVSDDRAFDAVGDVAVGLGMAFHRMSYRALSGMPRTAEPLPAEETPQESRGRGRRRGRRRPWRDRPPIRLVEPPAVPVTAAAMPEPITVEATNGGGPAGAPGEEAHTAPHDEIVALARDLIARTANGAVSIDTLANALKSRGFRRTPGSPRLITRLRRIRELTIGRNGLITIVNGGGPATIAPERMAPIDEVPADESPSADLEPVAVDVSGQGEIDDDDIGNRRDESSPAAAEAPRRRSRRGGRRRRGGSRRPAEQAASG
jgi:hypothetical protein